MFNNTLSGYSGGSQNLSGVFSFSDGMGTVIENGTITTNKAFVNNSSITQNNQLATKQYVDINGASALLSSNNIWFGTNDFTSNPITAKTEANTDNSTKVATTAFIKNQNYAPLDGVNEFTNINTFKNNAIEANVGINSAGRILITRAPGDVALQLQDTTSLNSNTLSINGNTAFYSMNGTSSGHSFFVRTSIGATSNVLSLTNTNVTITSTSMINTTATDAAVTDLTGKLATTRFVNSNQTNFLTLANTWTNQQTFSRTAENQNLRLLDSTNNSTFSFATNNNQVNMVMTNNDSKIFFNTNSPTGIQSDTLIINTTTTTLNTTNPLVQNATMPALSDSSNKTPTTAWVQSVLLFNIGALLNANNSWTGTNTYSVSFPTCSVAIPASSDSTTKLSTTQWTQSAITSGNSNLLSLTNLWIAQNTFQRLGIDIPFIYFLFVTNKL